MFVTPHFHRVVSSCKEENPPDAHEGNQEGSGCLKEHKEPARFRQALCERGHVRVRQG
jgi:hypothetical protein